MRVVSLMGTWIGTGTGIETGIGIELGVRFGPGLGLGSGFGTRIGIGIDQKRDRETWMRWLGVSSCSTRLHFFAAVTWRPR